MQGYELKILFNLGHLQNYKEDLVNNLLILTSA